MGQLQRYGDLKLIKTILKEAYDLLKATSYRTISCIIIIPLHQQHLMLLHMLLHIKISEGQTADLCVHIIYICVQIDKPYLFGSERFRN